MRAIASMPRSGREPCAARPWASISKPTKPLWASARRISVGSETIAASGPVALRDARRADARDLLVADGRDDDVPGEPRAAPPPRRRA